MRWLQASGFFALYPGFIHLNVVILKVSNGRSNVLDLVGKMDDAGIDSLLALLV
jgi:hypothetical protein